MRSYWYYAVNNSRSDSGSTTLVSAHPDDPAGLCVELRHENIVDPRTVTVPYTVMGAVALARLLITAANAVDPAATEKLIEEGGDPTEGRHTVEDTAPTATDRDTGPSWDYGTWRIAVRTDRRDLIEWRISHPNIRWFTEPKEAEQFAAVLLSAAARSTRVETT